MKESSMNEEYLKESIGFVINRVGLRIKLDMRRAFVRSGYDITPEQWSVLMRLYEYGQMSLNDLAKYTLKELPTLSRIIGILRKKGLVKKERSENDRRIFLLTATEKGIVVCRDTMKIARSLKKKSVQNIAPVEIEQVNSVLNRILKNLEENDFI